MPSRFASSAAPQPATGAALQLQGIDVSFGGIQALCGVDLCVAPGEIRAIIQDFDPEAFYTIEDVRHVRDIPPAYATAATGAGKARMPV